ncbi:hypothetical protein ACVIGB_008046 [Bradyrhizobium sp. USDA 4341]
MTQTQFSGYLMARPGELEVPRDLLQFPRSTVSSGPTFHFVDAAYSVRRWDSFTLESPVPLGEEAETARPPFQYPVFIVRGLSKFVILAPRRKIADYLIQHVLDRQIFPNFRRTPINIQRLIEKAESSDSEFLVTSLHGRFSGPGRTLRMMSLYGDDVTDSVVFRDHHALFNFFSCGLGRRLFDGLPRLRPNEEGEITRITNEGSLTLNLIDRRRAIEFLLVLGFVLRNKCAESWVPVAEGPDQL